MSKNTQRQRNQKRKMDKRNKKQLKVQKPSQPKVKPPPVDRDQLRSKWSFSRNIGPGLINAFNTCFLNAVLCCLTYTAPLSQYLLSKKHDEICTVEGFCGLCSMSEHVSKTFSSAKSLLKSSAISPNYFTTNLKKISSTLSLGRQEDAHEFFMFLLASFTKSYTALGSKLTSAEEDAGLVHLLFGGKLRSRVICTQCHKKSDSYDRYLDLSIDIKEQKSIKGALRKFVEIDTIGAENTNVNGYNCQSCKNKVVATKQMTVDELPKNLVIHMKRFAFDLGTCGMRKVTKHINYPAVLDMTSFISKDKHVRSALYNLYAVLIHQGQSCDSGHYYAYVKAPDGNWLLINDDFVSPVDEAEVLKQKAYMLFYEQSEFVCDEREKASKKHIPQSPSQSLSPISLQFDSPVLRSCLKRKRTDRDEDIDENQDRPETLKKVRFEESFRAVSTDPESWVVRPSSIHLRSLLGNQSPRTFSNAVGHQNQWIVRSL